MKPTAALLYGSLRWDILKGLGRASEARHDVGLELQESLTPDSALPELARKLQAAGHAQWSAAVLLGEERWALALIEIPSGPGHPRLAVELLALRVEHSRLLNVGDGQLKNWVLSVAREGSFNVEQRGFPDSAWLNADLGAVTSESGLFVGSIAACDAVTKLVPVVLVRSESSSPKPVAVAGPFVAVPAVAANMAKHVSPSEAQVSNETPPAGGAVVPRWLKSAVALQSLCIAGLVAAVVALFMARAQEAKEGEVARKQAVEQALKSQRLDLQSELLNDRETNRTALSARPTQSELDKKLKEVRDSLEGRAKAHDEKVADLEKSLAAVENRVSDLKVKVDAGGFAGDQAERLKKISEEIEKLKAQTEQAKAAFRAFQEASKKLYEALNPEGK